MKADYNSVVEIKKGNKSKREFFKNKLKESMKKLNIKDNDELLEEVFKEALDTYQEDTPIPFIYHLNGILTNKTDNNFNNKLTDKEIEIINLLLKVNDEGFLTTKEVMAVLNIKEEDVNKAIERLKRIALKNGSYIKDLFGNYQERFAKRTSYFKNKNVLTEKELEILGDYLGINGKDLSINDIALKYNVSYVVARKEIIRIFNLLRYNNNQELVLNKYDAVSKKIGLKANMLGVKLDLTALKIKEHYRNKKEVVKIKEVKKKKKTVNYKIEEKDLKILELLDRRYRKEISVSQFIELSGYSDIYKLQTKVKSLFEKIKKNHYLEEQVIKIFPNSLKMDTISTLRDQEIIETLLRQNKEGLTDEDAIKLLRYKLKKDFYKFKHLLYRKIKDNDNLRKEIERIYPEFLELKEFNDYIKGICNEQQELYYDNFFSILDSVITDTNTPINLQGKALRVFKELKGNKNITLPKRLNDTIGIINAGFTDNLPLTTIISNTDYNSLESMITDFHNKITGTKEKSTRFPRYKLLSIKSDDIKMIKDLYTPTLEGYPTCVEIKEKYNQKNNRIYDEKDRVLRSIALGENLDDIIAVWPSYKEDIIIKENFTRDKSIVLNSYELENIKDSNNTLIKGNIADAICALETSVYGEYASTKDFSDKLILAFRLGFFNKHPFVSKDIAEILKIDEEYIINLTKECLIASKDKLMRKGSSKIKI